MKNQNWTEIETTLDEVERKWVIPAEKGFLADAPGHEGAVAATLAGIIETLENIQDTHAAGLACRIKNVL